MKTPFQGGAVIGPISIFAQQLPYHFIYVVMKGGGLNGLSVAINLAAYSDRFSVKLVEINAHLGRKINGMEKHGMHLTLTLQFYNAAYV